MRIQGERPETSNAVTSNSPVAERGRSARTETAADKNRADRVQVSEDARLLNAAVQAATSAPVTSESAVERARQKLESGELGKDAERLADKLIDHLLR
jgi:flagellar biosynthesis anti-sigma factor FlgM